jgi:hypothetical protein
LTLSHDDIRKAVGSLAGASIRPLCDDHQPELDLEDGLVTCFCPNCGYRFWCSVETYLDLVSPDSALSKQDILKGAE